MFFCKNCGNEYKKWYGKCPSCKEFNTFAESDTFTKSKNKVVDNRFKNMDEEISPKKLKDVESHLKVRSKTEIEELDRVLGGGIIPASLILIGGQPGIGKSTLILEASNNLSLKNKLLYITGEESLSQIKTRSERMKLNNSDNFLIAKGKNLNDIFDKAIEEEVKFLIIDSIQTVYLDEINSTPGSISQLKECTLRIMYFAKQTGISIIIIGHITKDGDIAGPKLLEHMVDTVLYLEGEKDTNYKILRSKKNRYGATDEIGLFEMSNTGLVSVNNIENYFLDEEINSSGSTIGILEEGDRMLFVDVQTLLIPADMNYPKRTTQGFDLQRLNLLLGVLQKRLKMNLSNYDCYVNISAKMKEKQYNLDLAVVVSLISSKHEINVSKQDLFIGEVGLNGEIKRDSKILKKIEIAKKLGFKRIFCRYDFELSKNKKDKVENVKNIQQVLEKVL